MFNFLLACGQNAAASTGGCYDWPVIKQIVIFFGWIIEYIYKFFDMIGIANIGLVIIAFTLLVKLCLLPLTIKQQKFSKLTNIMQPELNAIRVKYTGRKDTESMQAMQDEQKAVYAKYGVSQMGGCLQTGIQMPVLIALYGALRQVPLLIDKLSAPLSKIVTLLNSSGIDFAALKINAIGNPAVADTVQISALYSLPMKGWAALTEAVAAVNPQMAAEVTDLHGQMVAANSFLGFDLSQTPWNLMTAGGIGIISILLPLIAGAAQWLSFKLTQAKGETYASSAANSGNPMAAANSMGYVMPLFSVFICFTLNASLGVYWAFSSLFQVVLQILINRHYRKIDMDAFVAENLKKAEEKQKKKREKKGVKGSVISAAANTNTKNIESAAPANNPNSIAQKANMTVGTDTAKKAAPAPDSLAAKAAMVAQYNLEHGEDFSEDTVTTATGKKRRKYKK
ncbi:MAG: YidC/Oxa1 family membrane protein insertase [Lachnospiraceae bacterium]|nr:YidC/Oxa1 family membrane protein insertase [Lachnospiraceae bacterium]